MGQYVRGDNGFEYRYQGPPCLCELEDEADVGKTELLPQITFAEVDDGNDLVCFLSGNHDSIPVDENETPFEAFRDFFISIRKYFENADTQALVEIIEDENGIGNERELLQLINAAENVILSAGCYFTLLKEEWPDLLEWVNENLETTPELTLEDLGDDRKVEPVIQELTPTVDDDDDLPLLGFLILRHAIVKDLDECVVHDIDDVWMTPVVQDGEVVTPDTEIAEDEDYMF
jgi:hypothetical protein